MSIKSFRVDHSVPRLDHYLRIKLSPLSRSRIEKHISRGDVSVNGKTCVKKSTEMHPGDIVEIFFPAAEDPPELSVLPLPRLFEDEHLLIIDKPSGISVHPGAGVREPAISDYFTAEYPDLELPGEQDRPGIVHRLDKGTSGVMILAKTGKAFLNLQKQFRNREVVKTYCAILNGRMRFRSGTVDLPLLRNPGDRRKFITDPRREYPEAREAFTRYRVRFQFHRTAYVSIDLLTGRTHQIRIHMSHLGNPVLGDELYGRKNNFSRLALHSRSIRFLHPVFKNRVISSSAPVPPPFISHFMKELNDI